MRARARVGMEKGLFLMPTASMSHPKWLCSCRGASTDVCRLTPRCLRPVASARLLASPTGHLSPSCEMQLPQAIDSMLCSSQESRPRSVAIPFKAKSPHVGVNASASAV
ncbi:hypothetical protein VTK73DRAFT_153 [Phialemonium thermophilum]|uniref:Uncharacterized protein n=1 Tax=Phialemonium thermophilum TaxID=223376 RepID=A0ABR3VWQ4_9PEZI